MIDIQIIVVDPVTNIVSFKLTPKRIKGIQKLVQIVVISLMQIPGRDVLDPTLGGGIPALVGSNIDPNDSTEVFGEVVRRIKKTETEIISNQIGSSDPVEEKLAELQIVDITQGATVDEIFVKIRVINQANQASDIIV